MSVEWFRAYSYSPTTVIFTSLVLMCLSQQISYGRMLLELIQKMCIWDMIVLYWCYTDDVNTVGDETPANTLLAENPFNMTILHRVELLYSNGFNFRRKFSFTIDWLNFNSVHYFDLLHSFLVPLHLHGLNKTLPNYMFACTSCVIIPIRHLVKCNTHCQVVYSGAKTE